MKTLVYRHFWAILAVFGALLATGAFLLGVGEGRLSRADPVSLSCSPDILTPLTLPVAALADPPSTASSTATTAGVGTAAAAGAFVGSKNGTKYYVPGCSSAKRIKPENYVWFKTAQDAKLQGYTPGRC